MAGALFISCARALDDQDVGRNLFASLEPQPDASSGGLVNTGGDGEGGGGAGGVGGTASGGTATGGVAGTAGTGGTADEPDAGMDPMEMDAGLGGAGGVAGGGAAGMAGGGTAGGGTAGGGTAGVSGGGNGGGGGGSGPNPVQLEGEDGSLTNCNGCVIQGGGDSGSKIWEFTDGDQICWANVDMNGITMATVHYGNGEATGDTIDISYGGNTIGMVTVGFTNGWSAGMMGDLSDTFTAQTGTGTVCLVGHGVTQIASIDYLDLE